MPRNDLTCYPKKVGYRKHPGMVMWLFHRISGVLIGLFFISHLLGIGGVCEFLGNFAKMKGTIAVVGLLFVLHTANGIRIMLMEFCCAADRKKFLPYLAATVCIILLVGGLLAYNLFFRGMAAA